MNSLDLLGFKSLSYECHISFIKREKLVYEGMRFSSFNAGQSCSSMFEVS